MTVVSTDIVAIEVAKKLGINTEKLVSFEIVFEVGNLVVINAKYFINKQGLKDTIDILTTLKK